MIKGIRVDHIILVVVAIVIAIEGGYISWNLYDSRDDVKVVSEHLIELKNQLGYSTSGDYDLAKDMMHLRAATNVIDNDLERLLINTQTIPNDLYGIYRNTQSLRGNYR